MTGFVIAAVVLTALALLFLVPPLLRADEQSPRSRQDAASLAVLRDQARELEADRANGLISPQAYEDARADLERRVLQDAQPAVSVSHQPPQRLAAFVLVLVLPVLAAALYFQAGDPGALAAQARLEASSAIARETSHDATDAAIGEMVQKLAARLRETPGDVEGWHMLARSYTVLERHRDAAAAYGRLAQLLPGDADVLADYADALATAQGATLKGEPTTLIARALAANPDHTKALALSGSAAFERGDYAGAAGAWKKVLGTVPPDSEFAQATAASIAEAEARASGRAARISGTVDLHPSLRASAAPGDTVFIYARAPEGGAMPLAVVRRQVRHLPARFVLDDRAGIGNGRKLSEQEQVVVAARVSRSGSASATRGDLEGSAGTVALGASDIELRIDSVRP